MWVIGIDPGGTIGVGIISYSIERGITNTKGYQETSVSDAWNIVTGYPEELAFVVIEDYIGAGQRDRASVMTLKQIGGFTALCDAFNFQHSVKAPGYRKANVSWAERQLDVGPESSLRHAVDGLAHAKSACDKLLKGEKP
jgi:hypothetical protein